MPDVDVEPITSTHNVFFAGIGGTGIVTVNQVLATAALRAGYEVESLDQIGLSQKAGPVVSHLRFAAGGLDPSNRLTPGSRGLHRRLRSAGRGGRQEPRVRRPGPDDLRRVDQQDADRRDGLRQVGRLSRDALPAEPAGPGVAPACTPSTRWRPHRPCSAARPRPTCCWSVPPIRPGRCGFRRRASRRPSEINGVAVEANLAAFRWGRVAIADPARFGDAVVARPRPRCPRRRSAHVLAGTTFTGRLGDLVSRRAADLVQFQSERVARRYVDSCCTSMWTAERAVSRPHRLQRSRCPRALQVHRLQGRVRGGATADRSAVRRPRPAEIPTGEKLTYRLHPPVLRALGRKKKIGLGPRSHVALRLLAKGKRLRGTMFDPFGYAHVRRVERGLRRRVRATSSPVGRRSGPATNYDRAVEVASLADVVRGYEGVKLANVETYHAFGSTSQL